MSLLNLQEKRLRVSCPGSCSGDSELKPQMHCIRNCGPNAYLVKVYPRRKDWESSVQDKDIAPGDLQIWDHSR